jgi:hypothetical protein
MSGMAVESRELRAFAPALVLLAIFALINFIDRGNLSIAAPLLKEELRISASELGILLSAFFWTYTAMQFVSGWIVDRFEVNRVIAAGFLLWSLATAATGLVRGFTMLLAMRLMLGIGESVMSPAYSKILSFHLPEHHRGFANGVLQAIAGCYPTLRWIQKMPPSLYYFAAWKDSGCLMGCDHEHPTVISAVVCISCAGGYVVAVENGRLRELNDKEERDFQLARYGDWSPDGSPAPECPKPRFPLWPKPVPSILN